MSDSSILIGKEKVHYEAIKRLRDLPSLSSNEINNLVRILEETVEDWNKMMGGGSRLPHICKPYLRNIRGNDNDAAMRLYFYLSPIIFYVHALHEAIKGSQRNVVTNCGIFGERIVNNLLFQADQHYASKILEEMSGKKFEDKNGKLKSVLEGVGFQEADELFWIPQESVLDEEQDRAT